MRARAARWFRRLRLGLPQPWATRLGRLVYLPKILAGDEPTRRAFAEEELIERLLDSGAPLAAIGVGLSERAIEIPWVLRRLAEAPAPLSVLDVGTAFAPTVYKRALVRRPHALDTLDLTPTELPGAESHVGDIRAMPFAADSFDFAVCVSTLEHIGLDNSVYGIEGDSRDGGDGDREALTELGRVARTVLVTVPAGRDANLGWLRQYSPATFRALAGSAGLEIERLDVFAHDSRHGWMPAQETDVETRMFGEGVFAAAAIICAELRRP